MCERTYVACGGCDEPADQSIRHVEVRYYSETLSSSVDSDGDPNGHLEEYGDPEYSDSGDSHYECTSCGWVGHNLDTECSPDDCDCAECCPSVETYENGDEVVALVRREGVPNIPEREEPWPPEIERLLKDRLLHFLPVTRERAEQISADCSRELDIEVEIASAHSEPFFIDLSMTIPEHVAKALAMRTAEDVTNDLQLQIPTEEASVGC